MDFGSLFLCHNIVDILHPMDYVDKRWSFREEISKLINASIRESFPDLEEEASVRPSQTGEPGDFICLNALTIWLKFSKSPDLMEKYPEIKKPGDIGEAINKNLPIYAIDMIGKEHSVQDVGIVPLSLSRKWLTRSIHVMLKHGIETWAPKLPVETVQVNFPKLVDDNRVGVFRREAIKVTLLNMLKYSIVGVQPELKVPDQSGFRRWGEDILKKSFLIEGRETHVVIKGRQTVPFILTMDDFLKSCRDLYALREVTKSKTVDWVVFVAPVRQQEYIEMCFTAAKHEKWIVTDRNVKWNPTLNYENPVATYAGYRTCSTEHGDLPTLLRQVRDHFKLVAEGKGGAILGYSAENAAHGVLLYTCLKNHRLADCTFNLKEMVEEEGNTFVHLLRTRAKIKSVSDCSRSRSRELINELKKNALDLILETYEREESEERALEFHLLEFAQILEDSCLSVLPHMMCEYLYDLAIKFDNYNAFVRKVGNVAEISKFMLCEATAVVMDKCFQLLGIDQKSVTEHRRWYDAFMAEEGVNEPDNKKQKMVELEDTIGETLEELKLKNGFIAPFVSGARDPARNSRFELFSFCPLVTASHGRFEAGKLFGLISVSDKYGIRSDRGDYLFEPDFPYVHLFDFEWCHARYFRSGRVEHFGNSSSCHSVPFSSSVEMFVQLYATTEKQDVCFQLSDTKFTIDLSNFWGQNLNSTCGCQVIDGEDGTVEMYYIAMKDAVDTTLEVKFNAGNQRVVMGNICAYYGGGFSCNYHGDRNDTFTAVLFASKFENGTLSLMKSELAVPREASLMIRAVLVDPDTQNFVLFETREFVQGCSQHKMVGVGGAPCSLELNVVWKCQAQ